VTDGQKTKQNILHIVLKIIVFIAVLYIAYRILGPLLSFLLQVSFVIIKIIVFCAAALFVIYFLLRLFFGIDLWQELKTRIRWK